MSTFLAITVALVIGFATYYLSPRDRELPFWPFQDSAHDRAFRSYDDQRAFRDLDAVRARKPVIEPVQLPKTGIESDSGSLAA
ncbi:hypothetical protein [Nocardia camponoti]|uniref:Uncharacterized protein n=1 Tax=Nocardia camponoti TaxID=1616106 RepID=A0A917QI05_9NOCA|nr:hypothetical protein [Nocardia camponoti]GGK52214.1 hypothetical protein GCM10011591_24930 [Nocardia camponoti]